MKIFLIAEYYPPLDKWYKNEGEPEGVPAIFNLYKYWGSHDIHRFQGVVFTQNYDGEKIFPNGSRLIFKKLNIRWYYLWKMIVYVNWFFTGQKLIKAYDPSIIYGQSSFVSVAAYFGKKLNIKSVGRVYGTILTRLIKEKKHLKIHTRHILELIGIKYPCEITICTRDGTQYDKVAEHFNKKASVNLLYNGMEKSVRGKLLSYPVVTKLDSSKRIRLASIARLYPYKRHEISIRVCEILKEKGLDVKLTILGSGPEEAKLKRLIANKNLSKEVVFLPQTSQEKMLQCMADQDICLMFYEGGSLGNVLWECALAGKLICSVDNGDTASIIKNGRNGIIHADDSDLVQNVSEDIIKCIDQDISHLTQQIRKDVSAKIPIWKERFDSEMELIESRSL